MFRLDYAASVHLAQPLAKLFRRRSERIPFLMYHSLSDQPLGLHPYYETTTSPNMFRRQMSQLNEAGLKGVSVREALSRIDCGENADGVVAITFDDGYRDVITDALPVLERFGFTATVYVIAEKCRTDRAMFKNRECLTNGDLRELSSRGVEIGSHTTSHATLYSLPWFDIEKEVGFSKQIIEQLLGSPVLSFCYPYAFPEADTGYVERFQALLEKYEYDNGVTTAIGTVTRDSDRYSLPRLPINTFDDERLFRAKLEGGYDWLRGPQYAFKFLKSLTKRTN